MAAITMSAGADVSAPIHPTGIVGGFEVEPCAWPSAVFLKYPDGICSGVYIGGRIVLTAAHCLPKRYYTDITCQADTDCPPMDDFGNQLDLTCHPDTNTCSDFESLVVNDVPDVRFGERYPGSDGHPRRTIPAQYCRKRSNGDGTMQDFAYCVLSEAPALQPVPVVMHCEVDQFLTKGTPLIAVGSGTEALAGIPLPHGTKHYLHSTLESAVSSLSTAIQVPGWLGAEPNASILGGDSGGPLFAHLPDGTWRVIGLAINNQDYYEPVWQNVEWMLDDPNVVTEQAEILPCHRPDGQWAPTAACGQFPLSPNLPAGDWTRGPFACNHEVSGLSATCGQPFGTLSPFNAVNPPSDPPMQPEEQ